MKTRGTQQKRHWLFVLTMAVGSSCLVLPIVAPRRASAEVLPGVMPTLNQSAQENALNLSGAFNQALFFSPRAASARARIPIAKSAYLQALTFPNPTFIYLQNFKADAVQELGAIVPVEPPWKVMFRLLAAKREISNVDAMMAQSLWSLRAETRRAYLEVVVAQELSALQTELLSIYRRLHEISEERFKAGAVPEIDVQKALLATLQAEVEQKRQAQRVVLAKRHLNIIMGKKPDEPINVPRLEEAKKDKLTKLVPQEQEPRSLDDFLALAKRTSPALKVVKSTISLNQANLLNTIGNISPNPLLTFGHLTANDIGPQSGITKGYWIGVNMNIPIFDFQQGNIKRSRATIDQLKSELASQENTVIDQVTTAYQNLLIARGVVVAYDKQVLKTSARVVQMNEDSYKYGRSDITAALVGAQLNIDTQTKYLQAISQYQQSVTDLELAVGQPLD